MHLIDMIDSNFFLKKLFPNGLDETVYIGQSGLSVGGSFSMNIHTKQKPALEVAKWGEYGQMYDVIVLDLLGSEARNVNIENWVNIDFAPIDFSKTESGIHIVAQGTDWLFEVTVGNFNFQRCSTYIDGRE